MTNTPLQSQERVGGALAYVFFLVPMLMKIKTDYTMFHAKQSFMMLLIAILASFVPFFGGFLLFALFLIMLWCIYQAYSGNRYVLPVIGENMETLISGIGLSQFFSTK